MPPPTTVTSGSSFIETIARYHLAMRDEADVNAPTIPEVGPTESRAPAVAPRSLNRRYEIRKLLGRGGMGEVWLAHDAHVDRDVALKVMRGDGAHDADAVARFVREARVQGGLEHPAIVPVHDLGSDDDAPFFTMKRLAGTTLEHVVAAIAGGDADAIARWSRRTLLARFIDACLAIELAHRRGVIHRDLKPANIMLGDFGETYVLDWGLARIVGAPESDRIPASVSSEPGHTAVGALLGTPGYMAPEQMRGDAVDARSDIYALGCILYEILAHAPALPRDRAFEATLATERHRPSRAHPDADVPPELDDACARATAADPGARFASARALADEVQRYLDGDRDVARRRELAAEHARLASERFAADRDGARAEVMREAGRSLALDPTNVEAQQLLARLLLEPPREVPAEARRAIEEERRLTMRTLLRKGATAYASNLAMVPVAMILGAGAVWPFLVVAALVVVLGATCWMGSRMTRPNGMPLIVFVMTLHAALLASVGAFFGMMFVPVLALGSLGIFLMFPGVHAPKTIFALHLLSVVVPVALELLGVVPATLRAEGDALVFQPWAFAMSPATLATVFMVLSALQMVVHFIIFNAQRRVQERSQEQIHVQSWHLAQLVPRS
jgi:serine/threonine-protein kinase